MKNLVLYHLSQALLALLAICFLLQIFSPLRLNTDAITLLSMADSASHGAGFLEDGKKTVFPPGYPALMAVLLRLGLAHSWVIIALNLVLLAVALYATYDVLREFAFGKTAALAVVLLSLLSFVIVKHCTIPLTDIPFFCFSMCCLAAMSRASRLGLNGKFFLLAAAAWALAIVAIMVRRIGIALLPALVFLVANNPGVRGFIRELSHRARTIIALIVLVIAMPTAVVIARTSTLSDFARSTSGAGIAAVLERTISYRLIEFGELFINFPITGKTFPGLHIFVSLIGSALLLLVLGGLVTRRQKFGPPEVYLISYMAIMFVWPFCDTRFWLPVIPLLIVYSALALRKIKMPKAIVVVYCSGFALLGLAAIAYSTRISFAGPKFPDRYASGNLRPTYCVALHACTDVRKPDPKALLLIQEFN